MLLARVAVTIAAAAVLGIASDPFVGTWVMNPAKTTYEGIPKPKNITMTITQRDDGLQFTQDTVREDGKRTRTTSAAIFDGKDHPIEGQNVDARLDRRVDPNHIESTLKKKGQVTAQSVMAVSADGKELTFHVTGTGANGSPNQATVLYEKQ